MGALGPGTCALATASNLEAGRQAKVVVYAAASTPGEKSYFEQALIKGEEVESLAVGKNFVACLTSASNLRVNTLAGSAIDAFTLTGSPVCLVAGEALLLCIIRSTMQHA